MPLDGIVTYALVNDLSTELVTGRMTQIHQPTDHELIITVRKNGQNKNLLLSVHPNYARVHLTSEKYTNPKEPPLFCMVLRKYLGSGFIKSVEQISMERIIRIRVTSKDEIGDSLDYDLYIELMGKHSHIVLVDPSRNVILESMKHIGFSQNRYRALLPGQTYIFPPEQGKINPLELDPTEFVKKLDFNTGKIDRQILSILMGVSPLVSQSIADLAYLGDEKKYIEVFEQFQTQLMENDFHPHIGRGQKDDFHVLKNVQLGEPTTSYETVSEMLDAFYQGKAERDRVKGLTHDIMRLLKNERSKNERKIKKQQQTLKKAEDAEQYQKFGELLTAHMHLVKPGDNQVTVIDYYDPDQKEITIELNPNKSASENAQQLFKQYQKLKKSKEVVTKEIEKAKAEIDYLDRLIQQLEDAREEDLEDIRAELEDEGYLKKKSTKNKKKKKKVIRFDRFQATDGTEIYVGRNNKQNEYLTNRQAGKEDIWLHTKDIPGSHVIIKSTSPSEETIVEAATIAAFYSKSKHSSSVPVDYTKVKHVRKPNGAKPGYVTYDNQQTVYVTPVESEIEKLRLKE